ncbi:MAG: sulfatase-like hydrolase/transferase, partial [Myxococcota bacterium]|nr:sulfatase-like hydrolase/transferase [Myxococcota bacterium]
MSQQWEKLVQACWVLEQDPSAVSKAVCLLVGFSPVLVFEGLWLCMAPLRGAWIRNVWKWGFINSHLLFYIVATLENHYYMTTGSPLTIEMFLYGLQHLLMLKTLLQFHLLGSDLVVRLALILLWATAGAWVAERVPRRSIAPVFSVIVLLVGLALPRLAEQNESLKISPSLWTDALGANGQDRSFSELLEGQEVGERVYLPPQVGEGGERMDVFVFVLESVSASRLPPRDSASDRLRHLSRMAHEGVAFKSAYTTISHTSKALTSMLCGFWPRPKMLVVEASPGGLGPLRCAPELLGELGYSTLYAQTALGLFENRPTLTKNLGFHASLMREDLAELGYEEAGYWGMDERALVEGTLDWLDTVGEAPVFVTMLTSTTHDPFLAPGQIPSGVPEDDQLEALVAVDDAFGTLIEGLEERGRLDNALVVILGDHGEGFGQHRRQFHDLVPFEEVTAVPLILW